MSADFDIASLAIQAVCPTNKIIVDNAGLPGVYVQRPKMYLSQLLDSVTDTALVHPAFLTESGGTLTEHDSIFIGKYQGCEYNGRIYSLPARDPKISINLDQYAARCSAKGTGHHCITAAEWAYLALRAKKLGTQPKGNNNYGEDISESVRVAIPSTALDSSGRVQHVATGSGPMTWSDTGEINGIWDLNGNVWEWIIGIRLVKGELQVIPYNNAAHPDANTAATSTEWRALAAAATSYADLFITPNGSGTTTGSIKLDFVSSHWQWQAAEITSQADESRNVRFADTTIASDVGASAALYLRAMALAPESSDTDYGDDRFYANNAAKEGGASRGGYCNNGDYAGVFALYFSYPSSHVGANLGGRPAYIKKS